MRIIPRDLKSGARPKGHWWPWAGGVWLSCPGCGIVCRLDAPREGDSGGHTIAADGTVSPSVDCPVCSFHDFVKLDGYGEGVIA